MSESKPVSMAPHLWEALEQMSSEMGVPWESLMAQAVFTFARFNGYVVPGRMDAAGGEAHAEPSRSAAAPAPVRAAPPNMRSKQPAPEPEPEAPPEDENPFDEQQEQQEEYGDGPEEQPQEEPYEEPEPAPAPRGGRGPTLTLIAAGRDPFRVATDVFTIGRGKSCDFVIDSNRVSREHVRITREGNDWVLEDLNSSNGTFFGPSKEKISKRKIKDGDEFTLGTEKIKFQLRK